MWPLHETCVENFLFSGVLCPCRAMCAVQCALHIRNTAHTAHGTCFMSSPVLCLYCHVLCTYTYMTARLCPFGCRVFLGEYSFGRFPICSQERRHSVWGWSVHTQFIPAVQFPGGVQYESSSTAEEEEEGHFFGHWAAATPPLAGRLWPNPGLWFPFAWWYHQQPASQCTHTPVQRRP